MGGELIFFPENLFPKEVVFDGGKVKINYLAEDGKGLEIETMGIVGLDTEAAKSRGFEELNDYRYALRSIYRDVGGKVRAKVMPTTMGLYNRFHRAETAEDVKNLELSMPVGGCMVLLTTESDGSKRMVLQYRINKDEYSYTPGVSTGGIMSLQYNDKGEPKPIEDVYRDHIESRLEAEVGLSKSQLTDIKVVGLATEIEPKVHHEVLSVGVTDLSFEELIRNYSDKKGTVTAPMHLISLPAEIEVIETLVSEMACPIPPSHLAAYVAVGYMMILEQKGKTVAGDWIVKMGERVKDNYERIDYTVRASGRGDRYRPYDSPVRQGLPDLLMALWTAKLLKPVRTAKDVEAAAVKENVEPSSVYVTGSVHFPKYGSDESDTQRGDLAREAIRENLESGYNMAVVVSPVTTEEYKKELEALASAGLKGKLLLLSESGRTYSGARRQAIKEALSQLETKYVISCEIEKKELLKYFQDFLTKFSKEESVGIVVMDRGIREKNPNLPWAQDWGELHQDKAISRHLKDAGFLPANAEVLDLLNGTRISLNKQVRTEAGLINPTSLMCLTYEYEGDQPTYAYGVDHYSAAVYHSVTMAVALGMEVRQVRVPYVHDEKQRELEEGVLREKFEKKREDQARSIIDQNFDLVANILVWKQDGKWPQIVTEAIEKGSPLTLKHFDSREYKLEAGRLIKLDGVV
jgi:hypothetical protein